MTEQSFDEKYEYYDLLYDLNNIANLTESVYNTKLKQDEFYKKEGETVLHFLASYSINSILKDFPITSIVNNKCNAGYTSLAEAAADGNIDCINILMSKGADFNVTTNEKRNLLMLAAKSGDTDCVLFFLEKGINPNIRAKDGTTALIKAIENGNIDCIKILINHGVDINIKDKDGWSPIMYAAKYCNIESFDFILSKGANINDQDNDGYTSLMIASSVGNAQLIAKLINSGVNVNVANKFGGTALFYAAQNGYVNCLDILIANGADVNFKEMSGETALMFATREGMESAVRFLIEHGADINTFNSDFKDALTIAEEEGYHSIAEILKNNGASRRNNKLSNEEFFETNLEVSVETGCLAIFDPEILTLRPELRSLEDRPGNPKFPKWANFDDRYRPLDEISQGQLTILAAGGNQNFKVKVTSNPFLDRWERALVRDKVEGIGLEIISGKFTVSCAAEITTGDIDSMDLIEFNPGKYNLTVYHLIVPDPEDDEYGVLDGLEELCNETPDVVIVVEPRIGEFIPCPPKKLKIC